MIQFVHHLHRNWLRYLAFATFAGAGITFVLTTGLHRELSFNTLALRYAEIAEAIENNPLWSVLFGVVFYVAFVVFAIPGIWLLGIAYGLLFGWALGLPLILSGAVMGASVLHWAASTAFFAYFRSRLGPMLSKLAEGFRKDAASYLLFLRFAPMFPFVIVNVAPGLFGVPYRTFLWTTLVGITPASLAYVYAGEGLRTLAEERAEACMEGIAPCGEPLSMLDVLNPQILFAFAILALLALMPILLRRWRLRVADDRR